MDGNLLDQLDKFDQPESVDSERDYVLKDKKRRFKEYNKLIFILIIILAFALYYAVQYTKYINLSGRTDSLNQDEQSFVLSFKSSQDDYISKINSVIPIFDTDEGTGDLPQSFDGQTTGTIISGINGYLQNNAVSYAEKKDKVKDFTKKFVDSINSNESSIQKIESDMGIYGFLPKEVDTVVSDNSLQRSIMSVEAIKLYSALTIFSKMDSFLENISSFLGGNSDAVNNQIAYYLGRGERDIEEYLTDCSLNPYQTAKCDKSSIDNFENFYKTNNLNQTFKPTVFKNLMGYLTQTLDNDSFPRLSITINSMDPVENKINFSIEINTFPDDEKALASQNILNPHIYISSLLLKLLRKSTYISGKDLKLDDLNITKKEYDIGGQKISVNNSAFNFDAYITKSVDREIYDYVYSK